MSFLNGFFISIFYKKVGVDQFRNSYYESKKHDYLGRKRRYVIYKNNPEPSTVPPMWHAWLHHMCNEAPLDEKHNFVWQKDYLPNNVKTDILEVQNKKQRKSQYEIWQPVNKSKQ